MKRFVLLCLISGLILFVSSRDPISAGPCPQNSPTPVGTPIPASTWQGLASLRTALAVYYTENLGKYPPTLTSLVPHVLGAMPTCKIGSSNSTAVQLYSNSVTTNGRLDPKKILGTAKWGYVNNPASSDYGLVFIDYKLVDSVYSAPTKETNVTRLGNLRSALAVYYADTEGQFPDSLSALVPRYLPQLPEVTTCLHGTRNGQTNYTARPTSAASVSETGQWGYVAKTGEVFISSREDNLYLK